MKHRIAPTVLASLVVLLLPAAADAQGEPPGTPVFRSTSRLTTLSVVVTDRQGHPVEGLRSDDFRVFDNGRPQKVAFFEVHPKAEPAAGSPIKVTPNQHSNQAPAAGDVPRPITVILFDTINSGYRGGFEERKPNWQAQPYGLRAIRIFLRQLQPEDRVGIYVLNRQGLKIVNDPQRPAAELLAAMARYDEKHRKPSARQQTAVAQEGAAPSQLDRFLEGRDIALPMNPCDPERFELTIAGLQEIARSMSGVNGRKSVIWVTDELIPELRSDSPLDDLGRNHCLGLTGLQPLPEMRTAFAGSNRPEPRAGSTASPDSLRGEMAPTMPVKNRLLTTDDQLDFLLRLLNREAIALYPVSAEGLQAYAMFAPGVEGALGNPNTALRDPGEITRATLDVSHAAANLETHEAMMQLASRTGGRAFFDRNDLETGIRRALTDSEYTYELAYYPDHNRWKGDWHKIEVKINRPDATVLARGGYYAFPEPGLLPPKARKEFLEEIAASPLEATEIPVTIKLEKPVEAGNAALRARVNLDPQKLFVSQAAGNWTTDFEVLFFQLTSDNRIVDVTTQNVAVGLKREEYEKTRQRGINTVQDLPLKPGASLLYVIVHDKRNDAVGSVRIPLAQYLAGLKNAP